MSVTPSLENRVVIDLRAFRVHIIDMAYTGGIISLISGEMRGPVGSRLYSWTTIRFRVALGVYVRGRFCTTESKEEPAYRRRAGVAVWKVSLTKCEIRPLVRESARPPVLRR
jgi:hypothetical protein